MPGANYMGGKRSAARARLKDHAGRLQKGYFGKQRLNSALARGLGKVKVPEEVGGGPAEIGLAHARKALASRFPAQQSGGNAEYSYIVPPSTPSRHGASESASGSSPTSKNTRSSKILSALDLSERIPVLRPLLDRPKTYFPIRRRSYVVQGQESAITRHAGLRWTSSLARPF
ncbi:hypothetical protein OE88DRAFT_1055044 [Heliocybe sulcata]|uniref:Uncharacterized protein n=1 Tax=Heliocybe sulcata TaxID=5364 RepID=A0A5C3MMW8_9AGAM|nr:hypothetical protein OE88DRAFT_1055044 [Heliocybe sulcata]